MKGIIILVNGFEDVEALATIDVLRRSSIQIDTASLFDTNVLTQSNHYIRAQYLFVNGRGNISRPDAGHHHAVNIGKRKTAL